MYVVRTQKAVNCVERRNTDTKLFVSWLVSTAACLSFDRCIAERAY